MSARPIIFKSSQWVKWTILLSLWILSFLILIIFARNNELNTLYNNAVSHGPELRPPKNQTGTVSYVRWDPKENYRPIYSVHFKNLRVQNNKLGIFRTALHKVAKIRGLELSFYRYIPREVTATTKLNHDKFKGTTAAGSNKSSTLTGSDISSVSEGTTSDIRALIKEVMRKLINPMDGCRVNNIDLGNVSEVHINNFDYKVLYDDELFFAIQSKRAIASYKHSGVVLRGHVIIKTADGSTLESNYVKWDTKKQHFSINGIYVLNRDGVKTTGKDICVDAQLKSVKAQHAKFRRKEEQECFAKL